MDDGDDKWQVDNDMRPCHHQLKLDKRMVTYICSAVLIDK
jgi:hypothetical protein